MLPEPVGSRIRKFRETREWTQEVLAAKMQVQGHSTLYPERITEIEKGRRVVRPEELVSFARVFRIRISDLLGVPDCSDQDST